MKTLGIIALVIGANYGLYQLNKSTGPTAPATVATMNQGKVVVYFGAPWCGPCRQTKPVVQELSADLSGKVRFLMINVDEEPELSQKYDIHSIPALVVLNDGKETARLRAGSKESMRQEILDAY